MKQIRKNALVIKAGEKYNHWTIIKEIQSNGPVRRVECVCDCGTKRIVIFQNLIRNQSTSCGCIKKNLIRLSNRKYQEDEMIGKKYDNWTINKFLPSRAYITNGREVHQRCVELICDCGNVKNTTLSAIVSNERRPKCKCLKENKNLSNKNITKYVPPIQWYIEQISTHPNFNLQTIKVLLNKLK